MEKNLNVELKVEGSKGVIEILEGKLPDPENRKPGKISGNINAPSEFWTKRNASLSATTSDNGTNYSPAISHVVFDYSEQQIALIVDEGSQREVTVIGKFVLNPIIEALKINKPDNPYESHDALYRALKFNGHIFVSKEKHLEVLKGLQNFNGKVTQSIKSYNDNKGNAGASIDIVLDNLIPLNFDIEIPIFSGEIKTALHVEVEAQMRNGSANFYLTCLELVAEKNEYIDKKFNELKADFNELAIICR